MSNHRRHLLIYLGKVQRRSVLAKIDFSEKTVLQGFEGSFHLENNDTDTTVPVSSNFATLFERKKKMFIQIEFFN